MYFPLSTAPLLCSRHGAVVDKQTDQPDADGGVCPLCITCSSVGVARSPIDLRLARRR